MSTEEDNQRQMREHENSMAYQKEAISKGDPRFVAPPHASDTFDRAAFDADWVARGKTLPPVANIGGTDEPPPPPKGP